MQVRRKSRRDKKSWCAEGVCYGVQHRLLVPERVWDVRTGVLVRNHTGHPGGDLYWCPNDHLLRDFDRRFCAGNGEFVWRLAQLQEQKLFVCFFRSNMSTGYDVLQLQAGSYTSSFSDAKGAGAKIFEVIDRVPPIDIFSEEGDPPNPTDGKIEFKNVNFFYPTRDDVQVRLHA